MLRRNRPNRRGLARPYLRAARAALRLERGMRQALYDAHRLMAEGEYLAAGEQFERLAAGAMQQGMVERAPFLYLQASRARLYSGQIQASIGLLRQGLGLLAQSERWPAVLHNGERAAMEYNQHGYSAQAEEVKKWLQESVPGNTTGSFANQPQTPSASPRGQLPAKCPYCGGNVTPDEVDWYDATRAECVYCGSVIKASN
jgi:hypothetical protein